MENSINERIKEIIESNYGGNVSSAARDMGIKQSTLKSIVAGDAKPSYDSLTKLLKEDLLGFRAEWVLFGRGKKYADSPGEVSTMPSIDSGSTVVSESMLYPAKPFIDSAYAICGAPSGFSIAIKEAECEKISLPLMKEYDFSIKAKGDSMINRANPLRSIRDGDLVACRFWKSRNYLRWGEVYALATIDGVIIKKIQESEKAGYIKCVSFNEEDGFTPYDLPLEEIQDWAIVIGAVSTRNWN